MGFLKESKCFYSKKAQDGLGEPHQREPNVAYHVVEDIDDFSSVLGVAKANVSYNSDPKQISDALTLSTTPKVLITARAPFSVVHANVSALETLSPWSDFLLSHCQDLKTAVGVLRGKKTKKKVSTVSVHPVLPDHGDESSFFGARSSRRVMYVLVELAGAESPKQEATQLVG